MSVSMRARNSSGVFVIGSAPIRANVALTSSAFAALVNSALSLVMIVRGVPAGARMPEYTTRSKPGNPDSIIVGTSGTAPTRLLEVTARPRILPAWMFETAGGMLRNENVTSFESTARADGVLPL